MVSRLAAGSASGDEDLSGGRRRTLLSLDRRVRLANPVSVYAKWGPSMILHRIMVMNGVHQSSKRDE